MIVKICGMTRREDVLFALNEGADFFGMICGIAASPRNNSLDHLQAVSQGFENQLVILTANETAGDLQKIASRFNPVVMQLHGDETPETIQTLKKTWGGKVWKAIHVPVSGGEAPIDIEPILETMGALHQAGVDRFVVDTQVHINGVRQLGGTGKTNDWPTLKKITALHDFSIILAGGLHPDNVQSAIKTADPEGVDVSSGVESEKGIKSQDKVRQFITEAKNA